MPEEVLFVAAEIGAARYLLPLWRHWLAEGRSGWRIVLSTVAANYLAEQGLGRDLPVLAALPQDAASMSSALDAFEPARLLVSAGFRHRLEHAAVDWARAKRRPVAQFVDSWLNYALRFERENRLVLPDRIAVIDDHAMREAEAEGLPADRLVVVGQPSWETATALPSAPPTRVLFLSGPIRAQYGDRLGYDEWSIWDLILNAASRHPDLIEEIWYGRHPVQTEITAARVAPARLIGESMKALESVGVVLGAFSSPMIDALIGGRRVISVQPGAVGPDMCPLSRHGRIPRVGTVEQLVSALREPSGGGAEIARTLRGSLDRLEAFIDASWS